MPPGGQRLLWSARTGDELARAPYAGGPATALGFTSDGQRLLVGNDQGLHLYRLR